MLRQRQLRRALHRVVGRHAHCAGNGPVGFAVVALFADVEEVDCFTRVLEAADFRDGDAR